MPFRLSLAACPRTGGLRSLILETVQKPENWADGTQKLDEELAKDDNTECLQRAVEAMKETLKQNCSSSPDVACRTMHLICYCMERHGKTFQRIVVNVLLNRIFKIAKSQFSMQLRGLCATFIRTWAKIDGDHVAAFDRVWSSLEKNCIMVEESLAFPRLLYPTVALQQMKRNVWLVEATERDAATAQSRLDEIRSELEVFASRAEVLSEREKALDEREETAFWREKAIAERESAHRREVCEQEGLGEAALRETEILVLEKRERAVSKRENAAKSRELLFRVMKEQNFGSGPLPGLESSDSATLEVCRSEVGVVRDGSGAASSLSRLSSGSTSKRSDSAAATLDAKSVPSGKTPTPFSLALAGLSKSRLASGSTSKSDSAAGASIQGITDRPLSSFGIESVEEAMLKQAMQQSLQSTQARSHDTVAGWQELADEMRVAEAISASLQSAVSASVGVLSEADVDRVIGTIVRDEVSPADDQTRVDALLFGEPDTAVAAVSAQNAIAAAQRAGCTSQAVAFGEIVAGTEQWHPSAYAGVPV
eukprot:678961-Rhodomonas_salina.4